MLQPRFEEGSLTCVKLWTAERAAPYRIKIKTSKLNKIKSLQLSPRNLSYRVCHHRETAPHVCDNVHNGSSPIVLEPLIVR